MSEMMQIGYYCTHNCIYNYIQVNRAVDIDPCFGEKKQHFRPAG